MDRSEFCEIDLTDRRLDIFFDDLLVSFARLARYVGLGIGNQPAVKKSAQRFFGWFYIRAFIHGSQDTPHFSICLAPRLEPANPTIFAFTDRIFAEKQNRFSCQVICAFIMLAGYWAPFASFPRRQGAFSKVGNIGAVIGFRITRL